MRSINQSVFFFSSQAEYNEIAPAQFDDSNEGGDEEHLPGGGVKSGGKTREERPGKRQMRRQETKDKTSLFLVCSFKFSTTH